jgi:hypothetical protein
MKEGGAADSVMEQEAAIGRLIFSALCNNQAPGLTSILSLTATPGFALFTNAIAFARAARVRTVRDNVTSFLTASAFTLRSADFNCGSFSSFVQTACQLCLPKLIPIFL